jgi:hypothetical protein
VKSEKDQNRALQFAPGAQVTIKVTEIREMLDGRDPSKPYKDGMLPRFEIAVVTHRRLNSRG